MSGTHKALTVKQPWAYAITQLGKDVENRSQRTRYRGPVLIHAGKSWAPEGAEAIFQKTGIHYSIGSLDAGLVIGQAHIVGCHHADWCWEPEGHCSIWAMEGFWHWELSNQQYFEEPFPAKGKLGLWSIGPDELPPAIELPRSGE